MHDFWILLADNMVVPRSTQVEAVGTSSKAKRKCQ